MISAPSTLINVSGCAFLNGTLFLNSPQFSNNQEIFHSSSGCLTTGSNFNANISQSDCYIRASYDSLFLVCDSNTQGKKGEKKHSFFFPN